MREEVEVGPVELGVVVVDVSLVSQTAAVKSFLHTAQAEGTLPPSGIWNSSGRAYPGV